MFTGLVEEVGKIVGIKAMGRSVVFSVEGRRTVRSLARNDSIAIDGVCLTVLKKQGKVFHVQAVEETLQKTTLGDMRTGSHVNLERPLTANGRLGGHFVLGHVDGTGTVREIRRRKSSWLFDIGISARDMRFLIPVGSVTVNGVSLTVAALKSSGFVVSIIPHTWEMTTFKVLREGGKVNIEYDVLGKYVLNFARSRKRK